MIAPDAAVRPALTLRQSPRTRACALKAISAPYTLNPPPPPSLSLFPPPADTLWSARLAVTSPGDAAVLRVNDVRWAAEGGPAPQFEVAAAVEVAPGLFSRTKVVATRFLTQSLRYPPPEPLPLPSPEPLPESEPEPEADPP